MPLHYCLSLSVLRQAERVERGSSGAQETRLPVERNGHVCHAPLIQVAWRSLWWFRGGEGSKGAPFGEVKPKSAILPI